jgi:hypothetical protein
MAKAAAPYLHPQLSAIAHRHASADGSPIGPTIKNVFMVIPKTIEQHPVKKIEHQPVVPLTERKLT